MTPQEEDLDQLRRQNAMLMRALLKAKQQNADLRKQLAEQHVEAVAR